MKLSVAAVLTAFALAGCASTSFQKYEGRTGAKFIEGEGGTREVIDGYDVWTTGSPPRRYQVLGIVAIDDFDNLFGNQRIRSALVDAIKQAGGDGAVMVDMSGGGQTIGMAFASNGVSAPMMGFNKKTARWQVVKYVFGEK